MVFFFISIADDIPETSSQETHGTLSVPRSDATDVLMLPENDRSNLEASSVYIPPDQMRMIQNINTIISEVCFFYVLSIPCKPKHSRHLVIFVPFFPVK